MAGLGRQRGALWTRVAAGALVVLVLCFWMVPMVQFQEPLSTVILDRSRELLGASIASDGQWRFGLAESVPERFVIALTRYEDRRFFYHPGVDPIALVRAALLNLRRRRVVSGGSTVTMQVVRLARKAQPRTLTEKAIETLLAFRLEVSLSKRQILGLYAAYAPFGGNTVGLDAASWRYFGHEAHRLSWAETAMLAVLPNAPALTHPGRNRDVLRRKRDRLLDSLYEAGQIDRMTCALAKKEPLPPAPLPLPTLAPHLLARIQASQPDRWKTGDASPWVRTTLDATVQRRAAEVVARHHRGLAENGVHSAAALVVEVDTGQVIAYVGNVIGEGAGPGEQVDVVPARRSTGSILKPLLYASMLEAGEILPGQLIPDVPSHFGTFHPENFDRTYAGAVPAELALARSLNVPAVRMLRSYGVDRFYSVLKRVGLTTLSRTAREYGLALILGGAEASLWDVTGVYAGVARSAKSVTATGHPPTPGFFAPTYLWGPRDARRRETREAPLHAGACYLTLKAMLEVERPGEELAWRAFDSAQRIAWKTGTSYGFRDAWAVGVTPRYAVGVWAGNADGEGRPGLTGYAAAAPILFELFDLLGGREEFATPLSELHDIDVCAASGLRAGPYCQRTRPQLVTRSGLASPPCHYCRLVHTDAGGGWQVHGDCEPVARIRTLPWFVLPAAMEVHYRHRHADYRPPPPFRPDCREAIDFALSGSLSCVYPKEGAQVYVPLEMSGAPGRVVFEAAHRIPQTTIYWHLDDEFYGETRDIHQIDMAPPPGPHVLTLVDAAGEMAQRRFTVLARTARSK
jgi:penicillin-binding protein 1C